MEEVQQYIGVKLVKATPLTRGDYNKYRGWTIPADEDPADDGYLVVYEDKYDELKKVAATLGEALVRLWDDDDMGFIVDGGTDVIGCGSCHGTGATKLTIDHDEGCVWAYLYPAIAAYNEHKASKEEVQDEQE